MGGDVGGILAFDITLTDGTTSKKFVNCGCPIIACDGGGSRVRYAMKQQGFTNYTEQLLGKETYVRTNYNTLSQFYCVALIRSLLIHNAVC